MCYFGDNFTNIKTKRLLFVLSCSRLTTYKRKLLASYLFQNQNWFQTLAIGPIHILYPTVPTIYLFVFKILIKKNIEIYKIILFIIFLMFFLLSLYIYIYLVPWQSSKTLINKIIIYFMLLIDDWEHLGFEGGCYWKIWNNNYKKMSTNQCLNNIDYWLKIRITKKILKYVKTMSFYVFFYDFQKKKNDFLTNILMTLINNKTFYFYLQSTVVG